MTANAVNAEAVATASGPLWLLNTQIASCISHRQRVQQRESSLEDCCPTLTWSELILPMSVRRPAIHFDLRVILIKGSHKEAEAGNQQQQDDSA